MPLHREERIEALRPLFRARFVLVLLTGCSLFFSAAFPEASFAQDQQTPVNVCGRDLPTGWTATPFIRKALPGTPGTPSFWESLELRSPEGDAVLLQCLPETGSGGLFVPELAQKRDDGLLGMGASYWVASNDLFKAVCEAHPYLGAAVTAQLPGTGTFLLESRTLPADKLLELCGYLLAPPGPALEESPPSIIVP